MADLIYQNPDDTIQKIKESLELRLPGEEAHLAMSPSGRGRSSELLKGVDPTSYRPSAVALILYKKASEYRIILTQRATYNGKHSGQISFPGGRVENFDKSILEAAIRETKEEIGVELSSNNVLGKMTDVYIPVSSFLVHPYAFYHDEMPVFKNNREVVETFDISLEQLLADKCVSKMPVSIDNGARLIVPCFDFNNYKVWGATAIILNEFKMMLKETV